MKDFIKTQEIILKQFQLNNKMLMTSEYIGRTDVSVWFNDMQYAIELSFKKYIAAQEVEKRECIYPTTWLDAFKLRWIPLSVRRLFPKLFSVNYTKVVMDAKLLYPKLVLPKHETKMIILEDIKSFNEEFNDS